jgi:hypothetical protein
MDGISRKGGKVLLLDAIFSSAWDSEDGGEWGLVNLPLENVKDFLDGLEDTLFNEFDGQVLELNVGAGQRREH